MSLIPRLAILAALSLALCACAIDPPSAAQCGEPAKDKPLLGETFMLAYQQSASIKTADLTLKFSKLLGDSRCPSGVQCIWEGNAGIEILLSKAADPAQALSLNTSARFATQALYQGYRIELVGLRPAPDSEHPNKAKDHCAALRVTKNE